MAEPLADVAALEARMGRPLDAGETEMATSAIAAASARVRLYGRPWLNPATVPEVVTDVVLAVAERRVRNPEGLRSEMLDGYQYQRATGASGTELTHDERQLIEMVSGRGGLMSVPIDNS